MSAKVILLSTDKKQHYILCSQPQDAVTDATTHLKGVGISKLKKDTCQQSCAVCAGDWCAQRHRPQRQDSPHLTSNDYHIKIFNCAQLTESKRYSQHITDVACWITALGSHQFYPGSTCFSSRDYSKSLGNSYIGFYSVCICQSRSQKLPSLHTLTVLEAPAHSKSMSWDGKHHLSYCLSGRENILGEKLQCPHPCQLAQDQHRLQSYH